MLQTNLSQYVIKIIPQEVHGEEIMEEGQLARRKLK